VPSRRRIDKTYLAIVPERRECRGLSIGRSDAIRTSANAISSAVARRASSHALRRGRAVPRAPSPKPKTGRTHQIRTSLRWASRAADALYGARGCGPPTRGLAALRATRCAAELRPRPPDHRRELHPVLATSTT
jgi:23S rRNA-/tRNA-specific pseudouridylate synthase